MSAKKNFIYNVIYQILLLILPVITTPYIARVIGPEGVGIQSYTYSIANYFLLFAMLGINNHGSRSIAMVRDNKDELSTTFFSIYLLQVITSITIAIFYVIYIFYIAKQYKIFFLIQMIYVISSTFDINWFFFGIEQFKLTVIRNTIIKLLSVCSIFIFVKEYSDLYIYSLIIAVSALLSQLILWRFITRYISFTKVTLNDVKNQIRPILILFIPVIAISVYKIMDKIMIGSMSTVIQVGFYENSEKIVNIPLGIITALGTVMLPKISNLQKKSSNDEIRKYIYISIEFVMLIAFGAMFGIIGVSPILIPIFLGDKFTECIYIVSLLSVTILFIAWANVIRTQFLIPHKFDKIYVISTLLGAVINFISNLIFISKYGAMGATIGTILAEAAVAIYQTIMVRKYLDIPTYLRKSIFYLFPAIVMFISIRLIPNLFNKPIITVAAQIIIGVGIYCLIAGIYMYITKNYLLMSLLNNLKVIKININSGNKLKSNNEN